MIGMTKITKNVYIDDTSKSNKAIDMVRSAIDELSDKGFTYKKLPNVLFCFHQKTFSLLGFKKSAARSIGTYSIVLGPRADEVFYLKHELIHQWQAINLDFNYVHDYSQWVVEGMAYYFSDDPRHPLDEPWETDRKTFGTWYRSIRNDDLLHELLLLSKK